jgi:hypothetical protein
MQCPNPGCPWWQGESPAALDTAVRFDGGRVLELPERAGPMLKAGDTAALASRARVLKVYSGPRVNRSGSTPARRTGLKYRVLRPWKKRFRGSKRYYARLERQAATFSFPLDRQVEIDMHEHFDNHGHGRRGFKHRRQHLRALFVAFRRVLDQAARANRPLYVFAYVGAQIWHSNNDALVVLSPHEYPAPVGPFGGVTWDRGVPGFLREHVHDSSWQVGVVERSGNRIYFVRQRD